MSFLSKQKIISANVSNGFTLVELMVAVAIFTIVATTAGSALMGIISANKKARSIQSAMNDVNLALESVSKDMRMGTDYECSSSDTVPGNYSSPSCPTTGGTLIKYKSNKDANGDGVSDYIYYKFYPADSTNKGSIRMCAASGSIFCNSDSSFSSLTSPEVNVTKMKFYVVNGGTTSGAQPRVVITMSGEAGAVVSLKTTFDIQTSVSQRVRSY
ncbi:MAG: type II secretion system protein [bacterium]